MIKPTTHFSKIFFVLISALLLTACGGSKTIPLTIQSDPLGAHVALQVNSNDKDNTKEWVYLGKTPLDIKRKVSSKQLKGSKTIRFKMMKDGYSDQVRDWNGKEIKDEVSEKGHVFWNPKMVQSN